MRDYKTVKPNKKATEKMSREEYLYHNTEMLLKKYRDVVWSIEVSAMQAEIDLELEMDCKLDEFLDKSYAAGMEKNATKIQEQMRTMERNKKMLKMIDVALDLLHKKQDCGEGCYWTLYYTYISEPPCKTLEDAIRLISDKTGFTSWKSYYKLRKKGIQILSNILWGFTSKECLPVIEEFVE